MAGPTPRSASSGVNVLMKASGDAECYWQLMARHVAERRGRLQLKALGFVTPKLLAWGAKVMVTTKGRTTSNTTGGTGRNAGGKRCGHEHVPDIWCALFLRVEDGHHVRTDDLQLTGSHEELEEAVPVRALAREAGEDLMASMGEPRRTITEKQKCCDGDER